MKNTKSVSASPQTSEGKEDVGLETPTPQGPPHEQTGATNENMSESDYYQERARNLAVQVEDEWQTVQDHLDDKRLSDSIFYLERLIAKASQLIHVLNHVKSLSGSEVPTQKAPTDTGGRTEHGKGGANVYTPVTPAAPSRKQETKWCLCNYTGSPGTAPECPVHPSADAAARVEPTKEEKKTV